MSIPFDTADKALQQNIARNVLKQVRAQRADYLADVGLTPARPKLGDPHKEPPSVPPLNRNPRKHDVVAWRNDSLRLDTTRHETKEAALEFAAALPWVIYCRYAVMDGRDLVQSAPIVPPDGMALDDNGMPIKV